MRNAKYPHQAVMPTRSASPATAVILPTLWSGSWIWRAQLPIIAAVAPQVVEIPDAMANWPMEPTLDAAEAYCVQKIDGLPAPLILVGASLGGLIALRIAARRPELVGAVVASGCPGLARGDDQGLRARFSFTDDDLHKFRTLLFSDTSCVDDALVRATAAEVANRSALRRGTALMRALRAYDAASDLHGLSVNSTLIWGERDRLSPPEPWRQLAQERSALHFCLIPGAGHVPMLEAPPAFNDVLRAALAHFPDDIRHRRSRFASGGALAISRNDASTKV